MVNSEKEAKKKMTTEAFINGKKLTLQVDTAAEKSICSLWTSKKFNFPSPQPTEEILCGASGHKLTVIGTVNVHVEINHQKDDVILYVVKNRVPTLLGLDWLERFTLNWKKIQYDFAGFKEEAFCSKLTDDLEKRRRMFKRTCW